MIELPMRKLARMHNGRFILTFLIFTLVACAPKVDHTRSIQCLDSLAQMETHCLQSVSVDEQSVTDTISSDLNLLQLKFKGVMDSATAVQWQRYSNLRSKWTQLKTEAHHLSEKSEEFKDGINHLTKTLKASATHDSLNRPIDAAYVSTEIQKLEVQQRSICENAVSMTTRINQEKMAFQEMRNSLQQFLRQKRVLKK